jgi:hypothetical protein
METANDLPGLRRLKPWIVIRAQENWRHLPPEVRGCMSFSEIAWLLSDGRMMPDVDQATGLVVREFERKKLANGLAWLVHDGGEQDFLPEDLGPVKKQRQEGSPAYVRGGTGEFTWDNPAQLREDLLDRVYVPLEEVERWLASRGWNCLMPHRPSLGVPETIPSTAPISDHPSQPTDEEVSGWFANRVANQPDSEPAPSGEEDWTAFRQDFGPAISRSKFMEWRRRYTPDEWHKQGPRKPWGVHRKKDRNAPMRN